MPRRFGSKAGRIFLFFCRGCHGLPVGVVAGRAAPRRPVLLGRRAVRGRVDDGFPGFRVRAMRGAPARSRKNVLSRSTISSDMRLRLEAMNRTRPPLLPAGGVAIFQARGEHGGGPRASARGNREKGGAKGESRKSTAQPPRSSGVGFPSALAEGSYRGFAPVRATHCLARGGQTALSTGAPDLPGWGVSGAGQSGQLPALSRGHEEELPSEMQQPPAKAGGNSR